MPDAVPRRRPPALSLPARLTGVRYVSFMGGHGYGDAADEYMTGLRDAAIPISWTPMVWGGGSWGPGYRVGPATYDPVDASPHADICNLPIPYDTLLLHINPWFYGAWLENEPVPDPGTATVGMMAWELDVAPSDWRPGLDALDLIIVPCAFNQQVVIESGTPTPVEVLPHIARPARERPGGSFGPITDDDFVFYTIGPWCARRSLGDTIRAYLDTFTAADDVALVVKTSTLDYQVSEQSDPGTERPRHEGMTWWTVANIVAQYADPAKLHVIAEPVPLTVIDQLHTRGDCYVGLTRGEGWGLGSFDAALFGNPPIVTGWGGVLDYLGHDYPLLVDYELAPAKLDEPYGPVRLTDDMRWARADRTHASAHMRWVYEHRDDAARLGHHLRHQLADRYESTRVTTALVDLLGAVPR